MGKFKIYYIKDNKSTSPEISKENMKLAMEACGVPIDTIIERTEKGKPYFLNSNVHFSISHSEDIWAVAFGDTEVGFDIQHMRLADYNGIAKRFFTIGEVSYIKEHGKEAFFDIWAMKEAYGKLTGEGFFTKQPHSFALKNGLALKAPNWNFESIDLGIENLKAMACIKADEDFDKIEIIRLK